MKTNFEIIPHNDQAYETVGNYWQDQDGTWQFRSSDMPDRRYCLLIFIHEFNELLLVLQADIPMEAIDAFDEAYETAREVDEHGTAPCGCQIVDDPGDDEHAPYHVQHMAAKQAERASADAMGVDWDKYEKTIFSLVQDK